MTYVLSSLVRTCAAELLKIRRTTALWVAVGAPLALVLLVLFIATSRWSVFFAARNPWLVVRELTLVFWPFVLFGSVTLNAAVIAGIEREGSHWKHVFVLPVPRWTIYVAKAMLVSALSLGSTIALWIGIMVSGWIIQTLRSDTVAGPMQAWETLRWLLLVYGASLFATAIQVWLSIRARRFAVAVGLGIVFALSSVPLGGPGVAESGVARVYPWRLPLVVARSAAESVSSTVVTALVGGLLVTAIGCWHVTRGDMLQEP